MASQLSRKRTSETTAIPDRLYFKIGDVARICELETYVLRFWETQFPQLKPNKSGTGQRLYRRRDVELALEIKRLVHEEGFTIAGARQLLDQGGRRREPEPVLAVPSKIPEARARIADGKASDAVAATIGHARAELREIVSLLSNPVQRSSRRHTRITTLPVSESLFPS